MEAAITKTTLRALVTSGGTSERIDNVRKITNMSTGRLGSLIADSFARKGAEVTYLCGEKALRPSLPMENIRTVGGVRQLEEELRSLLKEQSFACVVHSMAVSDYSLRSVTTAEELAESIAKALEREEAFPTGDRLTALIRESIRQNSAARPDKKISSNLDDMILLMEKTPKVIQIIKEIQPQTILVGFKLLAGEDEPTLTRVARELMERSRCDFIVANDLEKISGDTHKAMLIGIDGSAQTLYTKQEIAEAVVTSVFKRKGIA